MCLAIPGQIQSIGKNQKAVVNFGGVFKKVNCQLVQVKKGDWIIAQAGFAVRKLRQEDAEKVLKLYNTSSPPLKRE